MVIIESIPKNSFVRDWSLEELKYRDGSKVENPFNFSVETESKNAAVEDFSYQEGYLLPRLLVLEAQKTIVEEAFDFNGKMVAEFGAGAFGWFYNYLSPSKENWTQFDINPEIVTNNKRFSKSFSRTPKVQVGNIYDMPLNDESIEIIFGFNSWDSILFFKEGVKEVRRCLRPGGYFVHLQDLNPADGPFLLMEAKRRKSLGMKTTFPVRFVDTIIPQNFGYTKIRNVIGINSIDSGELRLGQYMNHQLSNAFISGGFNILMSGGIEKEVLLSINDVDKMALDLVSKTISGNPNSFGYGSGKFNLERDNFVPNKFAKQWAYMDVFVAQKPI